MSHSKMRFIAQIHDEERIVEVDNHGEDDGYYTMTLGDKTYHVDAQLMKSHIVSLLIDNHSYDVDIEKASQEPLDGRISVRVRGRVSKFEMLDERRTKMKEAASSHLAMGGVAVIESPMPGKVMKLLVKEGDEVTQGQGVIVVEAMKMENELKSPKEGVVTQIKVKEGATVEAGAVLLVIE